MSTTSRLIITILFGWLGIHKFFDKKPLQFLLYMVTFGLLTFGWIIDIVYAIQIFMNVKIKRIESTRKTLGIIFASMLLISCIGKVGTEDFSTSSFVLSLVSAISIIELFVTNNKNNDLSYVNTDDEYNEIQKYDNEKTMQNKKLDINTKIKSIVESKSDYLTGKFYDENNIILDKYKNLKTPKYIIIQIDEQLHRKNNVYSRDSMTELSDKYKDKYLNYADFFPLDSYWPQINELNEHQLRWYLYWRKEFLNNNILDTDISYIFLFAYELIGYAFNLNAAFNISALDKLYNSYKELYPKLDNYLPRWIEDMLSEVGYYYNQSDNEVINIEDDSLVNSLTTINELDKINIGIWKKHYNENRTDLTNKQLSLIYGNQKFYNRLKKYAGLLAKYYIDNKVDIIERWFEVKTITEKRRLFNGVHYSLQRMEGTYKYKKYVSNSTFNYDMNQITKLCYDLIYPASEIDENDYVINQYKNGKYDLPEGFFYSTFKTKKKSLENYKVKINDEPETKKDFLIDFTKINSDFTKINYVVSSKEKLNFSDDEKEFINMFKNNILDKKIAQQYCIKRGKMLNAYITDLNEKYFPIIHKEIVITDDDILKLNIEMEENNNDR